MIRSCVLYCFIVTNILFSQTVNLFELEGNNELQFEVVDSVIYMDHVNFHNPLILKVIVANSSGSDITIDNLELAHGLLSNKDLLLLEKGFSFCVFDSTGEKISSINTLYQPSVPDSVLEDSFDYSSSSHNNDSAKVQYLLDKNSQHIQRESSLKESNFIKLILPPKGTITLDFNILFYQSGDNFINIFPLEENSTYYIKLFYSKERYIEKVISNYVNVSISDKVKFFFK